MHIDSHFDSGNIEVVDLASPTRADLRIRKDAGDVHMQWFYFRVDGARGEDCTFRILNAGEASYPSAWRGYRVCTSVDRQVWTRVDTLFEDGVLTIVIAPRAAAVVRLLRPAHPRAAPGAARRPPRWKASPSTASAPPWTADLHCLTIGQGPLRFGDRSPTPR